MNVELLEARIIELERRVDRLYGKTEFGPVFNVADALKAIKVAPDVLEKLKQEKQKENNNVHRPEYSPEAGMDQKYQGPSEANTTQRN